MRDAWNAGGSKENLLLRYGYLVREAAVRCRPNGARAYKNAAPFGRKLTCSCSHSRVGWHDRAGNHSRSCRDGNSLARQCRSNCLDGGRCSGRAELRRRYLLIYLIRSATPDRHPPSIRGYSVPKDKRFPRRATAPSTPDGESRGRPARAARQRAARRVRSSDRRTTRYD